MKSLHKAAAKNPLEAWNPPDLGSEAQSQPKSESKDQVLSIFKKENEAEANPTNKAEESALHRAGYGKNISAWQPNTLQEQAGQIRAEAWDFIEITDTPFDRSWKVKAPHIEGSSRHEYSLESMEADILDKARRQAEEIILASQAEADTILLNAQAEIDEQKQAGLQQGKAEARAEIMDTLTTVKNMVAEMDAWKTDLLAQGESIVIEMVKEIARKMFGDGVELNTHALQANLDRIMENAHGLGALKIFLNPKDASKLSDSYWSEQQMSILGEQVKIVPSNNIKPGGCLIRGNMGTIDGRVDAQLDAILNVFDHSGDPEE